MDSYDCTIKHPSRILIVGQSQSGKTTLLSDILQNQDALFDIRFDRVVYLSAASELTLPESISVETYGNIDEDLLISLDRNIKNCLIMIS